MKSESLFIIALCTLALTSCQKDGAIDKGLVNAETIRYTVCIGQQTRSQSEVREGSSPLFLSDADGSIRIPMELAVTEGIGISPSSVDTKGSQVNTTGDNGKALSEFASLIGNTFVAKAFDGEGAEKVSQTVTWSETDSEWEATPEAKWPIGTSLNFLAYTNLPGSQTATITNDGVSTEHTVPASAAEQKDILFGHYEGDGDGEGTAEIRFEHPLTAVRFIRGAIDESMIIKSIELDGVAQTGTATMVSGGTFSWSDIVTNGYSVSQTSETGLNVDETTKVIGEPFIIIPQDLEEDNVIVSVTFNDNTVVKATISTGEWLAGKTNTYTLGYDPYAYEILIVEGDIVTDYAGGTVELSVTSDSPWKLQYTTDGGITWIDVEANTQINDFLQFDKVSGMGSDDAQTVTATVTAATTVTEYTVNHAEILQAAEPKGTADAPYDLSMHTIYGETRANPVTANCYVINSAGWYAFPLVYGNAIDYTKNGETGDNVGAYYPNKSGTNVLKQFTDCNGAVIGSPFISGVANAYPLWEDVADYAIISNDATNCKVIDAATATSMGLALGGKCGYVIFHVNQSTLQQGNTVIAITDGNATPKIMWSWHIWVTDDDLTCKTVKNSDASFYKGMFPENLGWVDSGTRTGYEGKEVQLRFIQIKGDEVKNEVDKDAQRNRHDLTPSLGQSPTYQWGRKDPFIRGLNMTSADELSTYSGTFRKIEKVSGSQATITKSIINPASFYAESQSGYGWAGNSGGGKNVNLWSANYTPTSTSAGNTTAPVKTIYDPCPPGFQVPQGNAFSGFSLDSTDGTAFDTIKGFKFKVTSDSSEYIYFPVNGFRSAVGGVLTNIGERGDYWTAVPSSNNGKSLHFQNNDVTPDNGNNTRAYGFTVRPVAE